MKKVIENKFKKERGLVRGSWKLGESKTYMEKILKWNEYKWVDIFKQ